MPGDAHDIGHSLAALIRAGDSLDRLPERVEAALRSVESGAIAEAVLAVVDEGLHPDRDYLPEQGAAFLGLKRSSYNRIPHAELPRRRGGFVRGVDLMAKRGDISYEAARAYKEAKAEAVLRVVGTGSRPRSSA
ncbi:MAG: hypothetical protein AAF594_14580 [Bacteroidota bacterium]